MGFVEMGWGILGADGKRLQKMERLAIQISFCFPGVDNRIFCGLQFG